MSNQEYSEESRSTCSSSDYSANEIIRAQEEAHALDHVSGAPNASLLYEPKRPFAPYIAVGPIIGMVSETIARVLIETSDDVKVRCFLTDAYGVQHGVARFCAKHTPSVFVFEELRADTEYRVSFNIPVPGIVKSTVRTLPANWGSLPKRIDSRQDSSSPTEQEAHAHQRQVYGSVYEGTARRGDCARIVSVSNHELRSGTVIKAGDRQDMWRKLYHEHQRNPVDYLLILGNLVYVDTADYVETKDGRMATETNESVFLDAVDLVEDINKFDDVEDRVLEMFRNVYRTTFTHPSLRHVLANIPCLAIPGEMELGMWLDDEHDQAMRFVHKCAYQVYNEYMRALFEDEDMTGASSEVVIGQAYHFHAFGDIGFMMLDNRAHMINHRTSKHQYETPFLGYRQWSDIDYALGESGYLSLCRTVIVASVTPIALVGESVWMKASMEKQMELLSTWACGDGLDEASLLLSKLFDWKNRKGGRNVVLLCGNLVNGGISEIKDQRYSDTIVQYTCGPVAALKHKGVAKLSSSCHNGIGVYHKFKHLKTSKGNSYACVEIKVNSEAGPAATGRIVF